LVPLFVVSEFSSEDLDLSGQQPVDHGDGLGGSVTAGDGDIDVVEGRVGVTEGDAGDVHGGGFHNSLSVGSGIGHDQ